MDLSYVISGLPVYELTEGDRTLQFRAFFKINIDELKISKERQFEYRFGKESSLSVGVCLRSLTADVIDMRLSKHLHPKEVETVAKKKAICRDAISKLLGKDISPDKVPVVGILGSGGGFRAMTGVAGSMQGMKDTGVLDCSTYIASLSGSTWYLSNLFCPNLYGEEEPDVDKCAAYLKQCCSKMGPHLFNESAFVKGGYIEQLIRRRDNGLNVSLVDLWGCYLASVFQMAKTGQTDEHKL
ncbi:cytosolic phospholipase A2-like isoform X2 [Oscarella lobularis]|uniref:cytosolic phospholipase A2-like isoform X2 n=1 Tax=Oscarella lobularis TaxID=121494 RepID=UPI003313FA95